MVRVNTFFALAALSFSTVRGIDLDVNSVDSIKSAASSLANQLVTYYNSSQQITSIIDLPSIVYWWEAGALLDTLIQYAHLTGDNQYNSLISAGLLVEAGADNNFMPVNHTATEGNDDQTTWALAAMSAAEAQLTNTTEWFTLADNVFNDLVPRWDNTTCSGGLRWQIFSFAVGYNYKNTASNGHFFQLASRLARYTGNSTYADWASTVYNWSKTVGFIDTNFNVYDGSTVTSGDCSRISKIQFSNNAGSYVTGLAHMYNVTNGAAKWKTELDGLLNRTLSVFFPSGGPATEIACEKQGTCSVDMVAFKGLLGHWLTDTLQMAPYTASTIVPLLTTTAKAAATSCDKTGCASIYDGNHVGAATNATGLMGPAIDALSYVQSLLWQQAGLASSPGTINGTTTKPNPTSTGTSPGATDTKKGAGSGMRVGMGLLCGTVGAMVCLML